MHELRSGTMTMMAPRTTRERQRWPLMALLLGAFLLSSCQRSQPSRQAALQVREVYRFEALPELVATSDVVVVGTVTSLEERTVGPRRKRFVISTPRSPSSRFFRRVYKTRSRPFPLGSLRIRSRM